MEAVGNSMFAKQSCRPSKQHPLPSRTSYMRLAIPAWCRGLLPTTESCPKAPGLGCKVVQRSAELLQEAWVASVVDKEQYISFRPT